MLTSIPMRIPRKITPDGLTDAVVVVGYEVDETCLQEQAAQFEQVFQAQGFQRLPSAKQEFIDDQSVAATYSNEAGLVVGSRLGQIGFNGVPAVGEPLVKVGSYIGWEAYRQLLASILGPLTIAQHTWTVVVVRYINILPWLPVSEQLRVVPSFPRLEGITTEPTFEYRLNWPVEETGFRVRLRLTDQVVRPGETAERGTLFDVEVTLQRDKTSLLSLPEALELAHQKQKEVFFGLLSPSFLHSLQPEYDNPS